MANEIKMSCSLSVTKGNFKYDRSVLNKLVTMNGTHATGQVQSIGFATHEAVAIAADVATLGTCFVRNLDATNYAELGILQGGVFYPLVRVNAGEPALFRWAQGVTPYAKANTAAVDLEFLTLEN